MGIGEITHERLEQDEGRDGERIRGRPTLKRCFRERGSQTRLRRTDRQENQEKSQKARRS